MYSVRCPQHFRWTRVTPEIFLINNSFNEILGFLFFIGKFDFDHDNRQLFFNVSYSYWKPVPSFCVGFP